MRPCRRWLGRAIVRRTAAAAAAAFLLTGCGLGNLQELNFRVDDRLHFVAPADRSKVRQPVTIVWRISGFRTASRGSEPPSRDAGYFAVFVDRSPIRPGQSIRAVASGDQYCRRDPKCPDATYLQQHGVYLTTASSLKLPLIANLSGNTDSVPLHTFTVVLMDTAGHRIGESAWELDLRIPKVGYS